MNYSFLNSRADLPDGLNLDDLANFLNEVMKPYEDTVPDIRRGLDYALSSEEPGRGGFVVLAMQEQKLAGAVVMLDTGMSGYVPANLLLFIAVHPELRGQGIGAELIAMVKGRCKGAIKLHVEPDNPALRLYERLGFKSKYQEMRFQADE